MPRSSKEIKEQVDTIEEGWKDVRSRMTEREDQLYSTEAYLASLESALAPEITTKIALPSRLLSHDVNATQGIINATWQFHVEPGTKYQRDEKRADKLELYYAYLGFKHIQPLRPQINRDRSAQAFGCYNLDLNPFKLPKEGADEYRKGYDPLKVTRIPPWTVSAMFDDNMKPTVTARHFKKPYIEIATTYGKGYNGSNALEICRKQFPMLRGDSSRDPDQGDLIMKSANVWIIDYGNTICHYIAIKEGEYTQIGDGGEAIDYPNPWGRPSVIFVFGRLNSDAQTLANKLEPITADEYRHMRNLDILLSHSASIALTPTRFTEKLEDADPDEVIAPSEVREGQITPIRGELGLLVNQLDVSVKDLIAIEKELAMATRPPAVLLGSEATIRADTAASYLGGVKTARMIYDAPQQYEVDAIVDICLMVKNWMVNFHNKGTSEDLYYVPTGMETMKGKPKPRQEQQQLSAADFDWDYTIEVSRANDNQAEMQAEYLLVQQGVKDNVRTPDELIAVFTEDVQGQKERLETYRRYQTVGPILDQFDLLAAVEDIRLREGRDYSHLLLGSGQVGGQDANAQAGANGGSPPRDRPTVIQQSAAEPPMGQPQMSGRA